MDLTAIVNTVLGIIGKFIESGAIEKIFGLIEKIAPSVEGIIGNLVEIISK